MAKIKLSLILGSSEKMKISSNEYKPEQIRELLRRYLDDDKITII